MNPLLQQALGSIVRFSLAGVFGYLVTKGIWTETEAAEYLGAAVLAILTIGWAIYQKYGSRLKLVTAMAMTEPATEKQIETTIKHRPDELPPVMLPKTSKPIGIDPTVLPPLPNDPDDV
jgi:hypothetical protein